MLPSLAEVLALPSVTAGLPVVRAGSGRLDRPVRWVHVSEVSWIASLLEGGELILTTGIALPRAQRDLRRYIDELAGVGVCGVVVELGRRYRSLPSGLVDAAAEADLPLIELQRETRFVSITQDVHTLILDARMRELAAADERQAHRALLTLLAVSAEPPPDTARRCAALGVPLAGRTVTALMIVPRDEAPDPAQLREIAGHCADVLQALTVPALVGVLDDRRVAVLLSHERTGRADPVTRRLADQLHAAADHRRGAGVVVAAAAPVSGVDRVQAALREATRVADTAVGLPEHRGWFRASDVRLHGLIHALRESDHLRDFVARELGPILAYDADHDTALVEFVAVYCRHGGNKTAAAAELFVSRAALYDRISRVERILEVDLGDAQTVLSLHLAVLARDALERPGAAVRPV